MSRILLRDLEPGRLYQIQARATNGDDTSQWSQLWDIQTTSDTLPPAPPTSLSWTVEGTAFKAVWTGPTTNQDGTPLMDFRDFQVKVYSPAAPGTVITYITTAARFDFPFESNFNSFGTPRATVNIEVRARDNTGNLSTAATATATNPPPADVTGLSVVGITNAIALRWTANTDNDIKQYEVYQGTSSGVTPNKVYTGIGTSFVFDTASTNPQYFAVRAVDVFNTHSVNDATGSATAQSSYAVDVTPPAAPTGVTTTSSVDPADPSGGTVYVDVSWSTVADTDLQYYSIRYSTGTSWQYVNSPEGTTSARINGLRPNTAYNIAVAAVDFSGNSSAYSNSSTYPLTTTKDTTAPAAPTGVTIGAGVTTITVYWNENAESDVKGGVGYYEIQLDTANTFNTGNLITKQTGGTITSFSSLTSNTTYYVRVRAFDASGNAGSYSSITSGVPRYIANSDIQAGTINGDRITAATIAGDRVIANSLDANTIKANTTFSQNLIVGSTFTMNASGIMQSANYSSGSAGWRLTNNSLEINQGTIKAAALLLQSGENLIHPAYADFEWNPLWYTANPLPVGFDTGSGGSNAIIDTTTFTPKYNIQALQLIKTAGGTYTRVILTSGTSTSYNLILEPSTDYIVSAWIATPNASGDKSVSLNFNSASGSSIGSPQTITANGTWQRISSVLTTTVAAAFNMDVKLFTTGTIYIDGVQIERKLSAQTTPSSWRPPSVTSIDGGIIRTGSIQSSAAANGLSGQPAWSINLQGNAQLGDVNVRGRLVVGDPSNPSADGVNSRIMSANYSAGTTGWIIRNDGYAEFRQLAVNSIKVTAFDSPFQNSSNAKMFDYMQDSNLWLQYGSVLQKTDPGAYSAESLFEFTGSGLVLRNGSGVQRIAFDPTILYRVSARIRAYTVATLNANSTFEVNTSGWYAYSSTTISRDTAKFFSGVASLLLVQNGTSNGTYGTGTTLTGIVPGYTYTFSARMLPSSTTARDNINMNIIWKDSSNAVISSSFNNIPPPVDSSGVVIPIDGVTWSQFSSSATAPAGAVSASFEVQFGIAGSAISGNIARLDEVTVTTPPRVKIGLFGFDNSSNIVDYDFVDVATTPTKIHAMPTDYSLLSGYTAGQYMMVANNDEVPIATADSSTTGDWITVTGYVKGRGGSGATGKFGNPSKANDPYAPASFNDQVRYLVPYVEWTIPSGSKAQLDQFSIEAFENGATAKVDTSGTHGTKGISIDNIQDTSSEFDHAIRFYTGDADEQLPGLIGQIIDGDYSSAGHLRIAPPLLTKESDYGSVYMGIYDRNPNYIYDSDFQNGIYNWTANTASPGSTVAWDTSEGRTEAGSLKITVSGTPISTTQVYGNYDISTTVYPDLIGKYISVSGYFKPSMLKPVRLYLNCYDETGTLLISYYVEKTPVNTTDYVQQAWTTPVVVPDTTATIRYQWWWTNPAAGESIWVDECQLETGSVTAYRDAQASQVVLNTDIVRSTGSIVVSTSDITLPFNVWNGGTSAPSRQRDVSSTPALIVQTDAGSGAMRAMNYTDSYGNRASANFTYFNASGVEETSLQIFAAQDDRYSGQFALTNAAGSFILYSYPDSGSDMFSSTNVRITGHLDILGTPPWVAATLTNGNNYASAYNVAYYKNNTTVFLRGTIQSYTRGSTIFTLPSGFRPAQTVYLNAVQWSSTSSVSNVLVQVNTNGTVQATANTSTLSQLAFDGLSFSTSAEVSVVTPITDTTAPGTLEASVSMHRLPALQLECTSSSGAMPLHLTLLEQR